MKEAFEKITQHQGNLYDIDLLKNPTLEYMGLMLLSTIILKRYVGAKPGSEFFVLPGSSRSIAENLAASLPLGEMSPQKRRVLKAFLTEYFQRGEEPLKTDLGNKNIPRLVVLGLINDFGDLKEYMGSSEDAVHDFMDGLNACVAAEESRELIQPLQRNVPKKKRHVVLRRIKDFLEPSDPR